MNARRIRPGAQVLHPQHGVGKVRSIRERSFYGHPKATYVELYFERDDLTVTVLEPDVADMIRSVLTADEAAALLERISDWKGTAASQWKARANSNQAAIDSGDPFEYIKVLKTLAQLEQSASLRLCDKRHFDQSLGLLTDELACALKQTAQEARALIYQAIGGTDSAVPPAGP